MKQAVAEWAGGGAGRRFPWILLLLIPSWASYLLLERPESGADSPFFFYIPDLTQDPLAMLPGFIVGPLLNTQTDQTILVTGQLILFGVVVERRFGLGPALLVFWGTSIAAALGAGAIVTAAHAWFPDAAVVENAWGRAYGGGSAAGFGLLGVVAATSRLWWAWTAVFVLWEASIWYLILQNFTPAFHGSAFAAGVIGTLVFARRHVGTRPV